MRHIRIDMVSVFYILQFCIGIFPGYFTKILMLLHFRVPGCEAVAHHCAIQDLDEGFYNQFHIIVCGLDSIVARRWLNGMLNSMLQYNDDGKN